MTKEALFILSEALQLPAEDRRRLAHALYESLEGDDAEVLQAWLGVVEERAAAIDRGETRTVPWSEARERIFGGH